MRLEDYQQELVKANKMERANRIDAIMKLYGLAELIINNKEEFNQMYPNRKYDLKTLQSRVKYIKRKLSSSEKEKVKEIESQDDSVHKKLAEEVKMQKQEQENERLRSKFKHDDFLKEINALRKEAFKQLEDGQIRTATGFFKKIQKKIVKVEEIFS